MPISAGAEARAKDDITVTLITSFKQLIADGTMVPGSRLPPERELAESFGVSRSSLRQALKVLEIMGVISQRVGDGTYLNSGASRILSEPMEFLILLDDISFHELMEARLIVEPELAARAAERRSKEDLEDIRFEMSGMAKAVSRKQVVEHDLRFHQAIFRSAGNRVCGQMFGVVNRSLENMMSLTSSVVNVEHTITLHKRVYRAIVKGDAASARRYMTEHLLDARDLLTRAAAQQQQDQTRTRIARVVRKTAD